MADQEKCPCAVCKNHIEFDLDEFLIEELNASNIVIFAGSGISTETENAAPHSLYIELASRLGLNDTKLPFPDLAEKFVSQPDGRFKLVRQIQERFNYVNKFRDLERRATSFYRELATMPYLNTFITTNWDRYFEKYCDAKPFVYDTDMRFWDVPRRKVLKVHGTIDDFSSLVATRADYKKCESRLQKSLIGAKLKEILATKTCIFIGYSLRDDDIKEIFSFVRKALGQFTKTHYFVSPEDPEAALPNQVAHVKTDGTFFLKTLKSHMCSVGCYADDAAYDAVSTELSAAVDDHSALCGLYDLNVFPQVVITAFYQDGLIHGYQMILDGKSSGRFSDLHGLQSVIAKYEEKIRAYKKERNYANVAYFRGYQNALIGFLRASIEDVNECFAPRFYFEKIGEMTLSQYKRNFKKLPNAHKAAFSYCAKRVKRWNLAPGVVMQHMPWG